MILNVLVCCEPTQEVKRLEADQQQGICYEIRKVLSGPSTEAPHWTLGNVTMTVVLEAHVLFPLQGGLGLCFKKPHIVP